MLEVSIQVQVMPLSKTWHEYNESLIERGRILMDIGFLGSSNSEIKNMNNGKIGASFEYSRTYIQFLAFLKIGFCTLLYSQFPSQ
jgi:hypothetical protein